MSGATTEAATASRRARRPLAAALLLSTLLVGCSQGHATRAGTARLRAAAARTLEQPFAVTVVRVEKGTRTLLSSVDYASPRRASSTVPGHGGLPATRTVVVDDKVYTTSVNRPDHYWVEQLTTPAPTTEIALLMFLRDEGEAKPAGNRLQTRVPGVVAGEKTSVASVALADGRISEIEVPESDALIYTFRDFGVDKAIGAPPPELVLGPKPKSEFLEPGKLPPA